MLIGFLIDSRNIEDIRDSIKSFGRLIYWQKDSVMARVVVKARVTDLEDMPHYLIMSEGDDFERVSITVQCEIIQQTLLGGQLRDEDIPHPGFEDNFNFPGIPMNQNENIGHQQDEHEQQNNLIELNHQHHHEHMVTDLNNEPLEEDQVFDIQQDQDLIQEEP